MMLRFVSSQRSAGVGDKDPAFWLPHRDMRKPVEMENAAKEWAKVALNAAHAFPPAGEKWNAFSLRSGAVSAAYSVGVDLYQCQIRGGSSRCRGKKWRSWWMWCWSPGSV